MIRIWLTLGIIGALVVSGLFGWNYYQDTQNRIAILNANNAKLELVVDTQTATLDAIDNWNKTQTELISTLRTSSVEAEQALSELQSILAKHNLTNLALAKPKMIERIINNATSDIFRAIECDTGSC